MFGMTIGIKEAFDRIQSIVDRFGTDHVAVRPGGGSGCTYAVREAGVLTPVCIVGQLFNDMGLLGLLLSPSAFDANSLDGEPSQTSTCQPSNPVWRRAEAIGIHFTPEAIEFLRWVQDAQDNGTDTGDTDNYGDVVRNKTWGNALLVGAEKAHEAAIRELPTTALVDRAKNPLAAWERELLNG